VAVSAASFVGLKPTLEVQVGDQVKKGQVLFTDKKNPGVKYLAPAGGEVAAIHRGAKRAFQSLVINQSEDGFEEFPSYDAAAFSQLSKEQVQDYFIDTGAWTFFRTRPFGKVPAKGSEPHAIFVNAMDTNPLCPDPEIIIQEALPEFELALNAISSLSDGKLYICKKAGSALPDFKGEGFVNEQFAGKHPAGLSGTHIHFLDPVSENKTAWSISYQQVIAIGRALKIGQLSAERVVSIAGPQVSEPKVVRTQMGASTDELCAGLLKEGDNRVIVGSVLSGTCAEGAFAFIDDSANQISVISGKAEREFVALMGHVSPHLNRHSVKNLFLSKLFPKKTFDFTAALNGGTRAMVPIGSYEEIMPLDILPTQLLRAILVGDTESAIALGALELVEEDVALCTYVCPGKYEYGPVLRDNLTTIEIDG
jgi:Na+-transporting NADH:ubiquinone oxidoreductase subunit A